MQQICSDALLLPCCGLHQIRLTLGKLKLLLMCRPNDYGNATAAVANSQPMTSLLRRSNSNIEQPKKEHYLSSSSSNSDCSDDDAIMSGDKSSDDYFESSSASNSSGISDTKQDRANNDGDDSKVLFSQRGTYNEKLLFQLNSEDLHRQELGGVVVYDAFARIIGNSYLTQYYEKNAN